MPVAPRPAILALAFLVPGLLVARVARADEKAVCVDAASQGQTLRDAHKMIEARDQFRICARLLCPRVVQVDCATWLTDAERAVPTVVVQATRADGSEVPVVRVVVDGSPVASALAVTGLTLDPGQHHFHVEATDGSAGDADAAIHEGERHRPVRVPVAGASTVVRSSAVPPLRIVGFAAAGVGVVGLVVGAIGGGLAVSAKHSASCVDDVCTNASELSKANKLAKVADVGLIGGAILAAGGVTLLFLTGGFSPRATGSTAPAFTWALGPRVAPTGTGLVFEGAY